MYVCVYIYIYIWLHPHQLPVGFKQTEHGTKNKTTALKNITTSVFFSASWKNCP